MPLVRGEWVSDGNDISHLVGGNMDEEIARLTRERDALRARLEMDFAYDGDGNRIAVEPGSIPDGIECRDATIKLLDERVERLTKDRDDWKRTAELAQRIATIAIDKFRDALDQHDRFAADTKARMAEMEALVAKAGLAPSDWMWPGYDKTGAL